MEAFPEAKVVLSVRNTTSWYKSLKATIHEHFKLWDSWPIKLMLCLTGKGKMVSLMKAMRKAFPGMK